MNNTTSLGVDVKNAAKIKRYSIEEIIIENTRDFEIAATDKEDLRRLLEASFPGFFPERIFYKQAHSFRLIAKHVNQIVGHVGIIYRIISINKVPYEIFGIADLCTEYRYRKQGIASRLLNKVDEIAKQHNIQHILLFTDEAHDLYSKLGYVQISAACRCLAIEELTSIKVFEKSVDNILMVHSKNPSIFQGQLIDLLGEIF